MTVANRVLGGRVHSHTIVRVPGRMHAADAPFVLLLVELDDGTRLLGHFAGAEPPPIDSRVVGSRSDDGTTMFSLTSERT
jgi:uncharacterized OB-fold protein